MSTQIIDIKVFSSLPWPSRRKIEHRLTHETLIIRSRAGFTFECRALLDGSIEVSNCTSLAIGQSLTVVLSVIELIDRLNPALMKRKVAK